MVNLKILFNHSDNQYSPGDTVNLEIQVQVRTNTTCRSIYIRLQGFSHVEWTDWRQVKFNGKCHTKSTTYSSHEIYFRKYQTLAGSVRGPEMELSPGSHVYHASFQLPENLPQNHEGGNGYIRYEAKVHMDVPWGFDSKATTSFSLRPSFDLNNFPNLREPSRIEASKTFGCCWESDPLHIFNVLPRRGFVPGDHVAFTLEMNNDSDVGISAANVKLVERIVYHAKSPRYATRDKQRTIWEHHFHDRGGQLVAPMQNKVFSTNLYFDPIWNLHFFNGCKIITVEYYLKSKVHTSNCHRNLSNSTWITIGTIPLNCASPFTPMSLSVVMPSEDFTSALPSEAITEQPLPTYNDAVSKSGVVLHLAKISSAGADPMETPPPTFTDLDLTEKKEIQ